jgi:hypothetical protein
METKLDKILIKAITGQVSLKIRRRLSQGETITAKIGEDVLTICVQGDRALLKRGDNVVTEMPFVPWGAEDDDYEAMIEAFGDAGEIDDDWFQRASANFHSRFA